MDPLSRPGRNGRLLGIKAAATTMAVLRPFSAGLFGCPVAYWSAQILSTVESWDHDHCAFCWATITDISDPAPDDRPAAYTDDVSWPASPSLSNPKPCPGPRWHEDLDLPRLRRGHPAGVRVDDKRWPGALSRSPAQTDSSLRHFLAAPTRQDLLVPIWISTCRWSPGQRIIRRSSRSERSIQSWGNPTQLEDIWNFEGLGFDMTAFTMPDGVHGEVAYGTTTNFLKLHGGRASRARGQDQPARRGHFPTALTTTTALRGGANKHWIGNPIQYPEASLRRRWGVLSVPHVGGRLSYRMSRTLARSPDV